MIPERIAEHISMIESARVWLRERGSGVETFYVFMRRPVLVISCPPVELIQRASRISEHSNGGSRSVWVASLNDCQIIWR
ncbi:TPA: hypothetical protein QH731_003556 [Klebsiella variicola]|nr:hypothetical protein [Klebsiella variicola]